MRTLAAALASGQATQPQVPFWLQVLAITLAPLLGFAGVAIGIFLSERNNRNSYVKDERRKAYQDFLELASQLTMFFGNEYRIMLGAGKPEAQNAAAAKLATFMDRAYRSYMLLRLIGSPRAVERASKIFTALKLASDLTVHSASTGKLDEDRLNRLLAMGMDIQGTFIGIARKDLGLPRGQRDLPFKPLPDQAYRLSEAAENGSKQDKDDGKSDDQKPPVAEVG